MWGLARDFARLRFSLGDAEGVKWQPLESECRRPPGGSKHPSHTARRTS
ncbi:Hypothetical protein EPM1_4190 [Stenotrophomonas maltophilia EPM1]|nr:Hypothetical protein EPM1_4190 [Stenotrophomonas maltophilia EPM1]